MTATRAVFDGPRSNWRVIDLATAASLSKVTIGEANGSRAHRLYDSRTGQTFGCPGVDEAAAISVALIRLRGLPFSYLSQLSR